MRAVRFNRIGEAAEVLEPVEIETPEPGPGELRIAVEAAGVNFADLVRRRGGVYPTDAKPPYVLGGEAVGRVDAVGTGVDERWFGTRVLAWPDHGCYSESVIASVHECAPVPEDIDASRLTALGIQGMTALTMLRDVARLRTGESVFVDAAGGGVGSLAVQLARLLGAGEVYGTASTPEKRAVVERLGAKAFDSGREDWVVELVAANGGRGVDVVLQSSAGASFEQALRVLGPTGPRLVAFGVAPDRSGRELVTFHPGAILGIGATIHAFYLGVYLPRPGFAEAALAELADHLREGRLEVAIAAALPLEEAARAHSLIESRQTQGKLVLLP